MPRFHHIGPRNGVIRCRTTLCTGQTAPPSSRLPGSCTWSLRSPALGPILHVPFDAPTWLPGPFGLDWGWAGPGRPRGVSQGCPATPPPGPPRATPRGGNVTKFQFSGGLQRAKISPCRIPERCHTVSNGTLQWSDDAVQPPVAQILHLEPSVAGLGRDHKCRFQRV